MQDNERAAQDAYLGRGIRLTPPQSSLLQSTSRWMNNGVIRDVLMTWILRKNGPDFPVEADHTLGLAQAFTQVMPDAEVETLFAQERETNPRFRAWLDEGFVSHYRNEDFLKYPPGTVGGIIGRQIRDFGFDLTLGVDDTDAKRPASDLAFWRLRGRQTHDLDHIIAGGQFNSIGEIVPVFAKAASIAKYLSGDLARALNIYLVFSGLRMVTRSLLHYPQIWPKALECLEQGLKVGRTSEPFWEFHYEDVLDLTPEAAREKLGVRNAYEVDSEAEAAIFREETPPMAAAAE